MTSNTPQGRIWLPWQEPLDFSRIKGELHPLKNYVDGVDNSTLADQLTRIRNPLLGHFGKVNLFDACTEAVIRSMGSPHTKHNEPEDLYYFLNPSKIGLPETPYQEKIPLITKILNVLSDEKFGSDIRLKVEGGISDKTSGFIAPRYSVEREDRTFWVQSNEYYNRAFGWEALMNIDYPDTHFLIFYDIADRFDILQERHNQENIFENGPLSFIAPLSFGYHVPILGVTKISRITYSKDRKYAFFTTLDKEGIKNYESSRVCNFLVQNNSSLYAPLNERK